MIRFSKIMLLLISAIVITLAGCVKDMSDSAHNVMKYDNIINETVQNAKSYDIIVMGEEHDNSFHHKTETMLFKALS